MTANSAAGGIVDRLQLLTVNDAAKLLGEDPKTTHRKLRAGIYPWVDIAGPGQRVKIRIRAHELDAFLRDPKRDHPVEDPASRTATKARRTAA